jgi:hypothetical protein
VLGNGGGGEREDLRERKWTGHIERGRNQGDRLDVWTEMLMG